MASFSNPKAPGSDELPIELYKKFGDILLPELLTIIRTVKDQGSFPMSMYEAVIVVLLKPQKHPN